MRTARTAHAMRVTCFACTCYACIAWPRKEQSVSAGMEKVCAAAWGQVEPSRVKPSRAGTELEQSWTQAGQSRSELIRIGTEFDLALSQVETSQPF